MVVMFGQWLLKRFSPSLSGCATPIIHRQLLGCSAWRDECITGLNTDTIQLILLQDNLDVNYTLASVSIMRTNTGTLASD